MRLCGLCLASRVCIGSKQKSKLTCQPLITRHQGAVFRDLWYNYTHRAQIMARGYISHTVLLMELPVSTALLRTDPTWDCGYCGTPNIAPVWEVRSVCQVPLFILKLIVPQLSGCSTELDLRVLLKWTPTGSSMQIQSENRETE